MLNKSLNKFVSIADLLTQGIIYRRYIQGYPFVNPTHQQEIDFNFSGRDVLGRRFGNSFRLVLRKK